MMRNFNRFRTINQGRRKSYRGVNGGGRGSPPDDSDSESSHTPPPRQENKGDTTRNRHRRRQDTVSPTRRYTPNLEVDILHHHVIVVLLSNRSWNIFLDYHTARGAVKSKLFLLTLKGFAKTWFKKLPKGSIDSWRRLCEVFTSHFATRKRQPKTVASLSAIVQDKKETLREYVEPFTREVVDVKGADDKLKCYILILK
ncbi:hypothetical protein TSUD_98060 [Trifolium subterraneum]|uniref:Retrotransposon gag domain-containing protein n=1 Tax=Trifolium subterraneum TaxID=3900 RepID=A0A2Z6MVI1_TRISU|nr:hypothetical protein TSUD_98060 [Trifolium subterraneum]